MATLLIAIVTSALSTWMLSMSRARRRVERAAMARIAAQEMIDQVRSRPFADVQNGSETLVSTVGRIQLSVTTNVVQSDPRMKLIRVTVRSATGSLVQEFVTAIFSGV